MILSTLRISSGGFALGFPKNEALICCLNQEDDHNMKGKADGSCSIGRTRAAINHNRSDRVRNFEPS